MADTLTKCPRCRVGNLYAVAEGVETLAYVCLNCGFGYTAQKPGAATAAIIGKDDSSAEMIADRSGAFTFSISRQLCTCAECRRTSPPTPIATIDRYAPTCQRKSSLFANAVPFQEGGQPHHRREQHEQLRVIRVGAQGFVGGAGEPAQEQQHVACERPLGHPRTIDAVSSG